MPSAIGLADYTGTAANVTSATASATYSGTASVASASASASYTAVSVDVPTTNALTRVGGAWRSTRIGRMSGGLWRDLIDGSVITQKVPIVTPAPASAAISTAAPPFATGTTAFPIDPNRTTL